MAVFLLRFDFRNPAFAGTTMAERYAAGLEALATLQGLNSGELGLHPRPAKPRGVRIELGASSEVAARRAARLGVGLNPATPEIWEFYRDELIALGRPDPGPYLGGTTVYTHVAEDVDKGWSEIAPFAMHDHNSYADWAAEAGRAHRRVETVDELREHGQYRVVTPDDLVDALAADPFGVCILHPLLGGLPPELAWRSLRLVEEKVLRRLAEGA